MGHLTFGIWIGYKKNLWIFFQKYGFIRKIEPFYLRMKHNINQMTATAGLAVPHSINPIFQYISDCLGFNPMIFEERWPNDATVPKSATNSHSLWLHRILNDDLWIFWAPKAPILLIDLIDLFLELFVLGLKKGLTFGNHFFIGAKSLSLGHFFQASKELVFAVGQIWRIWWVRK